MALLLNEDSGAGTSGNKNIYQNFFICLNYERRKIDNQTVTGLYFQYGIQVESAQNSRLYLNYFDANPLDPVFYSFGSRNADVHIVHARLEPLNVDEQIRLRCAKGSTLSKAIHTVCDYKCNSACEGCTRPYAVSACKKCAFASIRLNSTIARTNTTVNSTLCVMKCPNGYEPDLSTENKPCKGKIPRKILLI